MTVTTVGVIRERHPGEERVALTPEAVTRLTTAEVSVVVESGAGAASHHSDDDYREAGARVADTATVEAADVLCGVNPFTPGDPRPGQVLVGLFSPLHRAAHMRRLQAAELTVVSLDLLPRRLSRAQSMDALSSQANLAGYKAVLVAADTYRRYFPMLTTAAGTSSPANVLVLGTGVAGLSAIGTARRLGAVVTAYDVRPEARGEVESLGARFLELESVTGGAGDGGYARQLTDAERRAQQDELTARLSRFDVVITTAKVPGRVPPTLVTEAGLASLRPGSVVVDMAAGELGGNVATSRPDERFVTEGGVTVIGAGDLPARMGPAASAGYARNISAVLRHLLVDGRVHIDPDDEITGQITVTHRGEPVSPLTADQLTADATVGGNT
ncbi:NAD(P) transhydrogenase subunit alpha [Stackebrandtia albiflava]|uniref:proton-translocating NAD(P)(+) transhydrogenase n=1 Tax=Stackebrandtia albiflava TaxID=406432 RepID=A0A562UQB6_9ACTN|nr:NAD(P) transhydrogenase subunit alpha [Stackebrandtia albiflava]TWJ07809.1 NAD(P) transhydrogenase subunit alpha [Stackebrandtia albiflava]